MTVTIKKRTAVLFVALTCVLAGLALGQLTQAKSAASNYQLSQILGELKKVNQALGSGTGILGNGIMGKLYKIETSSTSIANSTAKIEASSSATCRAVGAFLC